MLADIVAKGGNLLLNIGPGPDGTWYDEAYARLDDMGAWLKINGEAIYSTRPILPYVDGKLRFTKGKDGAAYIIYLLDENEKLPAEIQVNGFIPEKGAKITMPGKKGGSFKWKTDGSGFKLSISGNNAQSLPSKYAVVFKVSKVAK